MDPETKKPQGEPDLLRHFHDSGLSLQNVGLFPLELSVARDKIVFNLGERTGNIWLAELKEEY